MKAKSISKPITQDVLHIEFFSLEQKIDVKLEKMREEHKGYRDEVMTKLDDISGQLENLQEDKVLSIHQTEELRDKVDNHEKRIKHLEKAQQTP